MIITKVLTAVIVENVTFNALNPILSLVRCLANIAKVVYPRVYTKALKTGIQVGTTLI